MKRTQIEVKITDRKKSGQIRLASRDTKVVSKAGTNPGVLFETFIATSSILKWISIFEDFF